MAARLPRKAFFRSPVLRWVLLGFYAFLVLVSFWAVLLVPDDKQDQIAGLLYAVPILAAQALFIFTPGVRDLIKPVHKKRAFFWPVALAAGMLAVLVFSFVIAMQELFDWNDFPSLVYLFIFVLNWIAWGAVFWVHTENMEHFKALKRLTQYMIGGSLLELLACIPAHIVVSRRPGCFVGMQTGMAVTAGICVMLWAFGPGIAILFLAPKHERETEGAASGGPIASAPLKRWNFSLGGLTLVILFLGSVMAVLAVPIDPKQPFMTRYEAWCMMVLSVLVAFRLLKRLSKWEKEE